MSETSSPKNTALNALLQQAFGFSAFRANQEAVCRAATDGQDVLLVMPTGAGKSLCYQIPVLARGGTGLVISPLIALMEDQAGKLAKAGMRVARIHSGLSREESRQACRDYLDGKLQFLFIAPERMRVPGFPEMLARRKPSLIAIDEAHCISAWGHDFRPDYRMLGDTLPALRPAPVIALTATATPAVQEDIVKQLQLERPTRFIHGFRRDNLSIEVIELSKPQRLGFLTKFLAEASRRPAIVYAPSRKVAEELAGELGSRFPAAAYHAGLEATVRERVQRHFQSGKLEVVVATIAFGMGIDKADVRTVIHYALPASVEAYYQEIGRAGRDGLPSRTVLLYSFADRKMHDFFLERDYPVATELSRVAGVLTEEEQMPDLLRQRLRMDAETFDRAVEKLAAQGAAAVDFSGNVRRLGNVAWQSGYERQVEFRRSQIDRMMAFAQGQQCRMSALIHHFGDTSDAHKPCGHCDFCAPAATEAQSFTEPSAADDRSLRQILRALADSGGSRATGRLFSDLGLTKDRNEFEALLEGLARAGLLSISHETFTNAEGSVVPYKKAVLTHEGRELQPAMPLGVLLRHLGESKPKHQRGLAKKKEGEPLAELTPAQTALDDSLRAWRKAEAAKTGKPAFLVFSDAVLRSIVEVCPQDLSQLGSVSGVGGDKLERYGAEVVALCRLQRAGDGLGNRLGNELGNRLSATSTPPPRPEIARLSAAPDTRNPGQLVKRSSSALPGAPAPATGRPAEFHRERRMVPAADNASLDAGQRALEDRLRAWRKSESEKMGLPQFFVLGATTLRSIVVGRPRTLRELGAIDGIGQEKLDRFGASILALCNVERSQQEVCHGG